MHLLDILALRPVPASAVFLSLTRRCPLSCRHCSTNSAIGSEEHSPDLFTRLVESFTPDAHPRLVLMSGGEALLRPSLVERIATRARESGTASYVLSGMFFARDGRIPGPIKKAIDAVDHFAASVDAFHEEEVPRRAVLEVLGALRAEGKDVSVQLTGLGDDDPYLAEAVGDIRETLGDRVPVLVGLVGPVGRAAGWLGDWPEERRRVLTHRPIALPPAPCTMAAWPVVTFDGTVVACCNQDVADRGEAVPHLTLGHAARDGWPEIRERCLSRPLLRAIRAVGPQYVASMGGVPEGGGYCETCRLLSDDPRAEAVATRPVFSLLDADATRRQVAEGAAGFARRYGSARYGELVGLGR
ncbi:radical SAM protein [Planotetraspora sp. A-T 1434]|uniref:radical SAM protein n=1 Tax=Planotetraspora sp. A-T 1434 TaxID=2979219 RepID=UPI0021C236E9|nr:radical SAM protein [Planotetraspora sp. A-T 1434]MCT9933605.1 radical SAM protein [Planotetraspora sp. A-T 1434]